MKKILDSVLFKTYYVLLKIKSELKIKWPKYSNSLKLITDGEKQQTCIVKKEKRKKNVVL